MVFYSISTAIIRCIGQDSFSKLPQDIQRRLVLSCSWSYGVSVFFISSILGIQILWSIVTGSFILISGSTLAVFSSLLIILPFILSYLTLSLWKFLKVRDRIFEQRYEPLLDLCSTSRFYFMVKCAVLGISLTLCLRELICNNSMTTIYEVKINDESDTYYNLNESSTFLLVWAAFIGVVFAAKMFLCNGDTLVFRPTESSKLQEIASLTLNTVIPAAVKITIRQLVYYIPMYYILFRLVGLFTLFAVLFSAHDGQSNFFLSVVLNVNLLTSSFVIGLSIHVIFGTLLLSLRIHNSQPLSVPLVRDQFDVQGDFLQLYLQPTSPEPVQYMAMRRLAEIASGSSPRQRTPFFQLSDLGGHAHTWNFVSNHCRAVIADFLKTVKSVNSNLLHKGQLPRTIVMQRTVLPDYLLARLHVADSSPVAKPRPPTNTAASEEKCSWLRTMILEWFSQSRPVQFVQAQLPFSATMRLFSGSQKALWAAETLASLAVASLTEDDYGVAQRDLSEIFEGLAGLHEAVERHLKLSGLFTLGASTPPVSLSLLYSEPEMPWRFRGCLNAALLRVVDTFSPHLDSLDLRKETRTLLQGMVRPPR